MITSLCFNLTLTMLQVRPFRRFKPLTHFSMRLLLNQPSERTSQTLLWLVLRERDGDVPALMIPASSSAKGFCRRRDMSR